MESTTTTWTCDRCGFKTEMRQGEQPLTWAAIEMVSPPRSEYQPQQYDHRRAHLCADCKVSVRGLAFQRQPEAAEPVSA